MTSTASQEHNGRELDREAAEASKLEIPDDDSSDVVMGAEEEEGDNQQRMAHVLKKEESKHNENDDSTDISTPFGKVHNEAEAAQLVEEDSLPPEPQIGTPPSDASFVSGPDDTPSLKVHSTCVGRMRSTSLADTSKSSIRSSPSNGVQPSRASSRLGISQSPQPFDHRFKARVSSSSPVPRSASPAFLTSHSRQVSVSSQLTLRSQEEELHEKEQQLRPWEVVRWTRLKKISHQAFSESGKRAFGRPTFLTIGASIAIGTSKGIILLFDYQQTLKSIIGQGTAGKLTNFRATLLSADQLSSRRMWRCHCTRHICGSFHGCRRSQEWHDLYLGLVSSCETFSSHPATKSHQYSRTPQRRSSDRQCNSARRIPWTAAYGDCVS